MNEFLAGVICSIILGLVLFAVAGLLLVNADETNQNGTIGIVLLICVALDIIPFAICLGQLI